MCSYFLLFSCAELQIFVFLSETSFGFIKSVKTIVILYYVGDILFDLLKTSNNDSVYLHNYFQIEIFMQ
jgi:hypothetical protein